MPPAALQRFSISSELAVPAAEAWRRACSFEGVNHELGPYLRMTLPRGLRGRAIDDLEAPARLGRSWLLLGGVLPVDFDDLGIVEIEPPRRFLESSRMGSMSVWEHERVIEPAGAGACSLTDRLGFELRRPLAIVPGSRALAHLLVRSTFRHRHRRLAALHGGGERR